MDEEMMHEIVEIVEQHPTFTLDQINSQLRARLPLKPHVGRICHFRFSASSADISQEVGRRTS
jgi:hypothetical protein